MTATFAPAGADIPGLQHSGRALNKWDVLDQIGFEPHPGQLKVMESTARNRLASCGRRFGKSVIGGMELVPEAFVTRTMQSQLREMGKRREFWIVGPEYSDAEKEFRVVYDQLKKLEVPFDRPGTYNDPIGGSLHISLWDGAFQVHGKSAKYPDTLVGEALSGVILSEAAKLKRRVWEKYISPTLKDFKGWSLMTSTPEGKNWFYEYWQKGQDPRNRGQWESWRMPAWYNPWVYRTPTSTTDVKRMQEIMNLPKHSMMPMREIADLYGLTIDDEVLASLGDTSIEAFNQEIGADFTEFVGRVFKEFDEEVHVKDLEYNPSWPTYAGVDYGFTNPNVWLLIQVGPFNEVHVLDEFYQPGLTAEDFADEIIQRGLAPQGLRTFYPDPADPGSTRILENKLRVRATGGTGGELRHRLDAIRDALREYPLHVPRGHVDRKPQLVIDRKCQMTIHEFNEYRYPEGKKDGQNSTKQQELPMKKDDHTPEALGRFFAGHFGTPQSSAGRRSTKAKFKR